MATLFDASPLGKIEIHGPDALEFLDRFHINRLDNQQSGRVRYGLMLTDQGVIFDDGTVVALGTRHVVVTTTFGGAGRVARWRGEWRQCARSTCRSRSRLSPINRQRSVWLGPQARNVVAALRLVRLE